MSVPARPDRAARLLHTSDWHLGVAVRGHPRSDDHAAVIAEILGIAEAAQPDLIVHTGDLFDGHRPAMADVGVAIRTLRALAEIAPVAVLSGNHDSTAVFDVLALALEDGTTADVASGRHDPTKPCPYRIRVHSKPTTAVGGAVTSYPTAAGGTLRFVGLPFVHQNRVLRGLEEVAEANATYADRLRNILASYTETCFAGFDPATDVAVLASHLHLRGARTSSEKTIHISEDYATDPAAIDDRYGYLAFGHIHVPQEVPGGRGRYAGSILQVDFGEEGESKQVCVVDLEPGRPAAVHNVALTAGRELRRLSLPVGSLDQLPSLAGTDLIELTVTADADAEPEGPLSIGGEVFDSLAAAVDAHRGDATIVAVIDGRRRGVVLDLDPASTAEAPPIVESFRDWLSGPGSKVLAEGDGHVDPGRVVELFEELHAVVTSGSDELDLVELKQLAQLEAATGSADQPGVEVEEGGR